MKDALHNLPKAIEKSRNPKLQRPPVEDEGNEEESDEL